jgi:hypothetical protein
MGVVAVQSPYEAPTHHTCLGKRPAGVECRDAFDSDSRQEAAWSRAGPKQVG